jgi:hypothetical protein
MKLFKQLINPIINSIPNYLEVIKYLIDLGIIKIKSLRQIFIKCSRTIIYIRIKPIIFLNSIIVLKGPLILYKRDSKYIEINLLINLL